MDAKDIAIIIVSVIAPLVGYMFAIRGFVKDTARAAVGNISVELASLRSELDAYRESQKDLIDLYGRIANLRNPHPDKEVLLQKLKNDTITREEAIALQEILTSERDTAERENDFLKAVVIIGILALVLVAINK
jgi:hypothetical protein